MKLWIDINTSADTTDGAGTITSPYNWDQFVYSLSAAPSGYTELTYEIQGIRLVNDDINIVVPDLAGIGRRDITFQSYDTHREPWKMYFNDSQVGVAFNVYDERTTLRETFLNVNDLIFDSDSSVLSISGDKVDNFNDTNKIRLNITNSWIDSDFSNIEITNFFTVNINRSTLHGQYLIVNAASSFLMDNNIVDFNNIYWYDRDVDYASFNNTVFTSGISAYDNYSNIIYENIQEEWVAPEILTTSGGAFITSGSIDYLSSDFSTISIPGSAIDDVPDTSSTWWNAARDGIGALYFHQWHDFNMLLSPTSGEVPLEVTFSVEEDFFNEFSATSAVYYSQDANGGVTSSTTFSGTYTYNTSAIIGDDENLPYVKLESYNHWFLQQDDSTFNNIVYISAAAVVEPTANLELDLITVSAFSATPITAFNPCDDIIVSGTVVSGTITDVVWDIDDGILDTDSGTSAFSSSAFYYTLHFNTSGSKTLSLSGYDELGDAHEFTHNISINTYTRNTYYVDINSTYITSGDGTSASPFDFEQMKERVNYNISSGDCGDIYKMKGYRTITHENYYPVFINGVYYAVTFAIDYGKSFTFDAWDLAEYGPWMFIVDLPKTIYEPIVLFSFDGSKVKNGIIYNNVDTYSGTTMIFSHCYDMFIVSQGIDSQLKFIANKFLNEDLSIDIIGCTINSENNVKIIESETV